MRTTDVTQPKLHEVTSQFQYSNVASRSCAKDEPQNGGLRVIAARILGNNMPPLQGVSQIQRNVDHILSTESIPKCPKQIEQSESTENDEVEWLQRIWIVNRILNVTARDHLLDSLRAKGELAFEIPFSWSVVSQSPDPAMYLTNQGSARNLALRESVALGADWILPLDGNVFLTDDSMVAIGRALLKAETAGAKYMFLPLYRLLETSRKVSGNIPFSTVLKTSKRMEAQVVFRRDAPLIFPFNRRYGDRNKYALIQTLQRRGNTNLVHCVAADIGFDAVDTTVADEIRDAENCGYAVRLPYHREAAGLHTSIVDTAPRLRSVMRKTSLQVFEQFLADCLGRTFWDEFRSQTITYSTIIVLTSGVSSAVVILMSTWVDIRRPKSS